MSNEFDVYGATMKVGGEAPLEEGQEFEHGDEIFVLSRAVIKEVSFPEDKDGNVLRVHKARLSQAILVPESDAMKLISVVEEKRTGQTNIIAEIERNAAAALDDEDDDDFV